MWWGESCAARLAFKNRVARELSMHNLYKVREMRLGELNNVWT